MGLSAQRGVLRRHYGERPTERPGIINGVGRIILTVLALAATSVLSGGCSASSSNGSTRTNGSDPIENARALAYAHAVNLRAADLPGWTSAGPEVQAKRVPFGTALARCGGAIYPALGVGGVGSLFRRPPRLQMELMQSGVLVTPSADVASRDVAANRSARVQACVARVITSVQPRGPSRRRPVATISPLPNPLPGVASYGLKLIATAVNARGVTVLGYQDVLGFASGPAVIALSEAYTSKGARLANEHELLSLLYSRAKAHHL